MKDREGNRKRKINNRDQRLSLWPWSWGQCKPCQLPRIQAYGAESIFMKLRQACIHHLTPPGLKTMHPLVKSITSRRSRRSPAVAPVWEGTCYVTREGHCMAPHLQSQSQAQITTFACLHLYIAFLDTQSPLHCEGGISSPTTNV